jgi:16S rRNA (guanine527-N7)-methyltransferase
MIAHKKGDINEEMNQSKKAIDALGGKLIDIKPVEISEFPDRRCLVVIEKVAATPPQYPRRSGMPVKNPLI